MLISLFNTPEPPPGLMDRMKQAVARTRTGLQDRMDDLLSLARPVDETALEELESTLIASDIGVTTSGEIIEQLRQQSSRQQIQDGAELRQMLKEEMLRILDSVPLNQRPFSEKPMVILMVGVNGTGKTTTTGKLAAFFREQGKSVLLCAADTFRAAAIEQLEVWSQRAGVEMVRTRQGGDPSRRKILCHQSAANWTRVSPRATGAPPADNRAKTKAMVFPLGKFTVGENAL